MPKHAGPTTRRPRRAAVVTGGLAAAVLGGLLVAPQVQASDGTCSLSGSAFLDADRDGTQDAGEQPRVGDLVYVFDGGGAYVTNASTGAAGHYAVPALACGTYRVEYAATSWWEVRNDLTPTTTGSLFPRTSVTLTGAGNADFGWRPILRSTTAGTPVDTYAGPEGLRVESYDDVVPAKDVYDAALRGAIGPEAAHTTIRFDLSSSGMTNTSIRSNGTSYDAFTALVHVDLVSWLDSGDKVLSHEYGHAWSLYRAYLVQQDPSMQTYLEARGLSADPRVNSGYAWHTDEMIAEDYRQLLGSASAAAHPQTNLSIPPAAAVPGLKEFLLGAFSTGSGTPAAAPTSSPSPSPTATASPAPSPSPSPTATVTASPTPTATATTRTKGGGGGRRK